VTSAVLEAVDDEVLTPGESRKVLRRTLSMLRPQRGYVLLTLLVILLGALALLAGPALVGYGIDNGLRPHRTGPLFGAAAAFLVISIAGVLLQRWQTRMLTRAGERFLLGLRVKVFDHIQSMPLAFFDSERTGKLVGRMTSDINALEDLVQQGLLVFITNGMLILAAIVVLLSISPVMFTMSLICMPVLVVSSRRFHRHSTRAYLDVRDTISQTLSSIQEGLSGVRVIQAFGREQYQVRRFSGYNQAQLDANMNAVAISCRYFPIVEASGVVTTAALVGLGGALIHAGIVPIGTVVAFVLYLNQLYDPIQQMGQLFNLVQAGGAALSKLYGLLDTPPTLTERPDARPLAPRGPLEVRDLTFSYGPGAPPALSRVNLTVEPGERLALVGPTGAGKSSLAKLMARMYDPTEGSVSFAGQDLRTATLESLRERMVIVPQEGFLFSGTILDNVRIGREDASEEEVRAALRVVGAERRFDSLPEGLATEVRERGSRLSAGERQLVSLARAALADPEVLVLDEATSSLDPGTELEVESAMAALMVGRTVVVIAHRLSTAERADRVAVVEGGRLVEVGSHSELLARGGRYAAMFEAWMGGSGSLEEAAPGGAPRVSDRIRAAGGA
jgi:ATP-binding cassette subfamily B protein